MGIATAASAAMEECVRRAHDGTITFAAVVARLREAGVESWHTDLRRLETTYYMPSGESYVVKLSPPDAPIAGGFDADLIAAAVREVRRGELTFLAFLRRAMAAGCVGYMVWIAGRQVQYFGRHGEHHIEHFPAPV